jgi:cytochrome c oxidase cbb3-type subunit 2
MYGFARCLFAVTTTFYLLSFAGGRAIGQAPKDEATGYDAAKGRASYSANCSACHQANGEGLPGVFPPLNASGVVNKDDATKHIHIVLAGLQGAKAGGVLYTSAMPPFAGMLSDADIADIVDYERSSWGNHGEPVTAAQVAAERANSKGTEQR